MGKLDLEVELSGGTGPLCVVGPNGSGKTTLLRVLAGAHRPATGQLRVGGTCLLDSASGVDIPIERRGIAYVPQGYGLFLHLSVLDNTAFGLSTGPGRRPRRARRQTALRMLDALGCAHLADRSPARLSGGEQQRVALARALVIQPRMLLLDEPLAALDAAARRSVRSFLVRRLRELGRPSVLITHDVRNVRALQAPVCVLEAGRIVQRGSLDQLREEPRTPWVAELVGTA